MTSSDLALVVFAAGCIVGAFAWGALASVAIFLIGLGVVGGIQAWLGRHG